MFVSDSIVAGEGVLETERIELPRSNPGLVMEGLPINHSSGDFDLLPKSI